MLTGAAGRPHLAVMTLENLPAAGANDLDLRLLLRVGVLGDDVRREQLDGLLAVGAGSLHDPEVVQHVAGSAPGIR